MNFPADYLAFNAQSSSATRSVGDMLKLGRLQKETGTHPISSALDSVACDSGQRKNVGRARRSCGYDCAISQTLVPKITSTVIRGGRHAVRYRRKPDRFGAETLGSVSLAA